LSGKSGLCAWHVQSVFPPRYVPFCARHLQAKPGAWGCTACISCENARVPGTCRACTLPGTCSARVRARHGYVPGTFCTVSKLQLNSTPVTLLTLEVPGTLCRFETAAQFHPSNPSHLGSARHDVPFCAMHLQAISEARCGEHVVIIDDLLHPAGAYLRNDYTRFAVSSVPAWSMTASTTRLPPLNLKLTVMGSPLALKVVSW